MNRLKERGTGGRMMIETIAKILVCGGVFALVNGILLVILQGVWEWLI